MSDFRFFEVNGDQTNVSNEAPVGENPIDGFIGGVKEAASSVADFLSPDGFGSRIRSKNIPTELGSQPAQSAAASFSSPERDWRVRISLPNVKSFLESPILKPLQATNNALIFPYTPSIIINQSANYDSIQPIHNNYPYYHYQNSQIEQILITGEFFVESAEDARYWTAMLHYLRSMTKMFYGNSENKGNPPPLTKLNGYGDYVFKNVPIAITNFTVDLQTDVDYIGVEVNGKPSYAPTQSLVSVTVLPMYSRKTVSQFSLDKFVKGEFVIGGAGLM